MRKQLNIGFITTVSGRWPRELPNERLVAYSEWLTRNIPDTNVITFDTIIDSTERLEMAITSLKQQGVDLVVMLYGAFTGDDICTAIADELDVPIILWAPREPELNGGRLIANALVALTMNSASMHRLGHTCHAIYGGNDDPEATTRLIKIIKAYDIVKKMKGTLIGLFGYRPTAFYNSAFDEGLIRRVFGIRIEETDLKVVFDRMNEISKEDIDQDRVRIAQEYQIVEFLSSEHYENHSRLYLALKQLVNEQGYSYSAIKCWPEMGSLKTTPCAVLGRLADDNVHIGCEGDVDVTLAMIAQNYITNQPNFITDLIEINEEANYLTFWHCGNAAPSLHDTKNTTVMGNHPLAGQGTAFNTPLKQGSVTISRFCNINGTYKLLVIRGKAVETELYTPGCIVNVETDTPVKEIIYGMIEKGIPHHYSIVWADVADTMIEVAKLLNLEVIEY